MRRTTSARARVISFRVSGAARLSPPSDTHRGPKSGVDSDVTSVVKNNKVSTALYGACLCHGDFAACAAHAHSLARSPLPAAVGSDVNVTIQSDTVVDGELYSYDNDNSLDQGNTLKTYHGASYHARGIAHLWALMQRARRAYGRLFIQRCVSCAHALVLACSRSSLLLAAADHAVYKNNTASSDYMYSDKYVDVGAGLAFRTSRS